MLRNTRLTSRHGAILIVVLALLSLFAIVGITFVLVAGQNAEKQRILRDASGAENGPPFVDDGQGTFSQLLSTLLTDAPDSGTGLQNSLRGHSLMATMYGRYSQITPAPILGGTTIAWNGTGNFAETATTAGVNRQFLINFRQFPGITQIYDPEISGERAVAALPGSGTGSVHIPKNAPYTYPDINNLILASICPATGEVLVPSFFRQAAFGGSLDRNNPNWTNAQGKYLILRPRPQEHPQFPYPPQNADGTTTGDVQNLPGAYVYDNSTGTARFISRNDSIWTDVGMPIITGRDGKRYKPLVAPLILDLDGRVNLSVAGNRMLPVIPPPAAPDDFIHTSGHGLGPWEIGLEKLFAPNYTQEARNLVYQRGLARNRANQLQQKYAPRYGDNQEIPLSAQIAWTGFTNGGAGVKALQYPPTNMYQGQPTFALGHSNLNALVANHPALFNPTEWPGLSGFGQPRGFSIADTKLLSLRYAFSPSFYAGMDLATFAPNSLRGSFPVPNPNPPQQTTQNPYRLDPAHTYRQLVTTLSADLDRPGLMPGQNQATNAFAALGGIDLNRTLADYRADTAQPLVPANMNTTTVTIGTATLTQADLDRQRFAKDIFTRLIVANSPAMATLDAAGNITIDPAATPDQLNVLRGLAQLAANIVDYIDADDVSTSFVWNPAAAADPYAPTNYDPAQIANRVVFGTEKPRFTISEFYAEVVNDPNDPGATGATMASFAPHVRLWGEFRNASTTPYSASINGPQGDGAVRLQYDPATEQGATQVVNPYRVEIVRNVKGGANVSLALRDAALSATNVTGAIVGTTPDLIYGFTQSLTAGVPRVIPPADGNAAGPSTVVVAANVPATPAGPQFTPARTGWNVINADPVGGAAPFAFTSSTSLAMSLAGDILVPEYQHLVVLLRRLANPNLPESPTNPYITIDVLDHVRAGDRIIRADMSNMDRSPKMTAGGQGHDPNTPPAAAGDPDLRPQASGKVQPYASFSQAGLPPFPNSMVMYQDPATAGVGAEGVRHTFSRQNSRVDVAPAAATYVPGNPMTPSDANLSGETIMTPYDWLVHLDRPLINQIELLHVSAGKPYELTLNFLLPDTRPAGMGHDVQKSAHTAQWLPVAAPHPLIAPHPYALYASLYRALDLLRIQPYGHQTALGGRIAGKININTIQDKRVWDALFDSQPGHGFTQTDVDNMWTALIQTRTRNMAARMNASGTQLTDSSPNTYLTPIPGTTIYDANADNDGANPYDRPFLPLGAATITAPGSTFGTTASAFAGGIGRQDTILRSTNGVDPTIWFGAATDHPYQRAEALRKILNNTTTVSNVFAVWATVGYFEVTTPAGTAPEAEQWGKEFYLEIPGDMRQRLFAIVDRTQLGLDPVGLSAATKVIQPAQNRPFFTTVESNVAASATPTTINIAAVSGDATAVQVYSDGVPVNIVPSATPTVLSTLVIGSGADQEIVNVTAVSFTPAMPAATPPTTAYATLTVASLAKDHRIGTCVSNIVPGNPGPQNIPLPTDDFSPFRTVIPHWSRMP